MGHAQGVAVAVDAPTQARSAAVEVGFARRARGQHQRFPHRRHRRHRDQPAPAKLPHAQLQLHPLRVVGDAGVHRAGRAQQGVVAQGHGHQRSCGASHGVADGVVAVARHVQRRQVGPLHAQRCEQARAGEGFPGLPADAFDGQPGQHHHQVGVLVAGAQRRVHLEKRHPRDQAFTRQPQVVVPKQVVARQAGAVAQHVAQADRAVFLATGQPQVRDVGAGGRVPGQLAFVDQHGHRGCGEGLGGGAAAEQRVGGNGQRLRHVAHAETLQVDDLAVFHQGHREARHAPGGALRVQPGVQPGHSVGHRFGGLCRRPARRSQQRGRGQCQGVAARGHAVRARGAALRPALEPLLGTAPDAAFAGGSCTDSANGFTTCSPAKRLPSCRFSEKSVSQPASNAA